MRVSVDVSFVSCKYLQIHEHSEHILTYSHVCKCECMYVCIIKTLKRLKPETERGKHKYKHHTKSCSDMPDISTNTDLHTYPPSWLRAFTNHLSMKSSSSSSASFQSGTFIVLRFYCHTSHRLKVLHNGTFPM